MWSYNFRLEGPVCSDVKDAGLVCFSPDFAARAGWLGSSNLARKMAGHLIRERIELVLG